MKYDKTMEREIEKGRMNMIEEHAKLLWKGRKEQRSDSFYHLEMTKNIHQT